MFLGLKNSVVQNKVIWFLNSLAICAFLYLSYTSFTILWPSSDLKINTVATALFCYMLGHMMRILRLILLLIEQDRAVSSSISAHLFSSIISFSLPYKLGDIARIAYLSRLSGSVRKGTQFVVIERIFDAFFIFSLVIFSWVLGINVDVVSSLLTIVVAAGLCFLIFLYVGIDPLCAYIEVLLLKSSISQRSIKILKVLIFLQTTISALKQQIKLKGVMLLILTCAIWSFELLALFILTHDYIPNMSYVFPEAYGYLSGLFTNEINLTNYRFISAIGLLFLVSTFICLKIIQTFYRSKYGHSLLFFIRNREQ